MWVLVDLGSVLFPLVRARHTRHLKKSNCGVSSSQTTTNTKSLLTMWQHQRKTRNEWGKQGKGNQAYPVQIQLETVRQ